MVANHPYFYSSVLVLYIPLLSITSKLISTSPRLTKDWL